MAGSKPCKKGCTCGRHKVPESRKRKLSAAMQGNTSGQANRGQLRPRNGRGPRPEHRSESAKRKTSETLKKRWAEGRFDNRPTRQYKPSSLEIAFKEALDGCGIKYIQHPKVKTEDGNFVPDFLLEDGRYVEVNGCFWHCCPECYDYPTELQLSLKEKDEQRLKALESVNIHPEVIWEHAMKTDQV